MKKFLGLALAVLFAGSVTAQDQFQEGKHYLTVHAEGQTEQPTITEFFSFYCGNCYNMETRFLPMIVPELEKRGLTFEQKHVNFARDAQSDQTYQAVIHAFAATQEMGEDKKIKDAMFTILGGKDHDHVHGDKHGEGIKTLADVRDIYVQHGIDAAQFDQVAAQKKVAEKVTQWQHEQRLYQIGSIPTFVVNNKYQIQMGHIETVDELINLMEYLAKK